VQRILYCSELSILFIINDITKDCIKIVALDDDLFKVQQINSPEFYEVNVIVGHCSCPVGKYGSFYKHQAAVYNLYHHKIPNLPSTYMS
jgi:hypothetical protein